MTRLRLGRLTFLVKLSFRPVNRNSSPDSICPYCRMSVLETSSKACPEAFRPPPKHFGACPDFFGADPHFFWQASCHGRERTVQTDTNLNIGFPSKRTELILTKRAAQVLQKIFISVAFKAPLASKSTSVEAPRYSDQGRAAFSQVACKLPFRVRKKNLWTPKRRLARLSSAPDP